VDWNCSVDCRRQAWQFRSSIARPKRTPTGACADGCCKLGQWPCYTSHSIPSNSCDWWGLPYGRDSCPIADPKRSRGTSVKLRSSQSLVCNDSRSFSQAVARSCGCRACVQAQALAGRSHRWMARRCRCELGDGRADGVGTLEAQQGAVERSDILPEHAYTGRVGGWQC
jgi:hypothetical protein